MRKFHLRKYCYLVLWLALFAAVAGVWLFGQEPPPAVGQESAASPAASPTAVVPQTEEEALVGVWVPYFSLSTPENTQEAFEANYLQIAQTAKEKGVNAMFVHVRPFSDALYPSAAYPWSHILTGTQGQDPGFDPLDILLQEAHSRGLSVEAWVNPYRLRSSAAMPPNLAENNLASTHPEWVCAVGEGLYLNPAEPAAADYVVQGVAELVQNYAVDGIHFDDYFYPATEESIDAAQFAASGAADLAAWRRENVSALVRKVYRTVKAADPTLRFGISPQGNPDNDLNGQYSDVTGWLASGGEEQAVDYLCPQVYWGYGYTLQSGSTRFAFENIVPAWLAYPRAEGVALYFGLGAYRVGVGDGGANADSVSGWSTGSALARQVEDLRGQNAGGWALYRYGSLFGAGAPALAAAECEALRALNG